MIRNCIDIFVEDMQLSCIEYEVQIIDRSIYINELCARHLLKKCEPTPPSLTSFPERSALSSFL